MILMIQKKRVTSGTLLSILRAREGVGRASVIVVMARMVRDRTWRLPDCVRRPVPRAGERRQDEDETAARPVAEDDVAPAGAREAPGERQPQPRGALRVAGPAHAGIEDALAKL